MSSNHSDNYSLKWKQSTFKNLGEIHEAQTVVGVGALRDITHRFFPGYVVNDATRTVKLLILTTVQYMYILVSRI